MFPLCSTVLAEAISIASTSLREIQPISLGSFLQCLHLHQSRFPILIVYVINRQLKRECSVSFYGGGYMNERLHYIMCFLQNKDFLHQNINVFLSLDRNLMKPEKRS